MSFVNTKSNISSSLVLLLAICSKLELFVLVNLMLIFLVYYLIYVRQNTFLTVNPFDYSRYKVEVFC